MNRMGLAFILALALLSPAALEAQDTLRIVIDPGSISTPPSGEVLATTGQGLQGYVLVVGYQSADPASGNVEIVAGSVNVTPNVAALSPDLVVPQVFSSPMDGFTLGVVMETQPPFDNTVIPSGVDVPLAQFDLNVVANPQAGSVPVEFTFQDGLLGDPVLDNVLVQSGMSLTAAQGNLSFPAPGSDPGAVVDVQPLPPGDLSIVSVSAPSEQAAVEVPITLSTDAPVQGFAIAVEHEPGVSLEQILRGASTQPGEGNAEFFQPQILSSGGTLGVVLDFQTPFGNQTLTGQDLEIAKYVYSCDDVIFDPAPAQVTHLSFVDAVLGSPALDNILVINNQSVTPNISNGTLTCEPVAPGLMTTFLLGGIGDTNSLLASDLPQVQGVEGGEIEVGIYYSREFPLDPNAPDAENSNIQGFTFVLCFPEVLEFRGFSVDNGILGAIGAEFVNTELDPISRPIEIPCDPQELPLDPAETPVVETTAGRDLAIGVLLDFLPPFDGQTAPATPIPGQVLLAGSLTFGVADDGVLQTDSVTGLELCEASLKIGFCLEPTTIDDDDQAAPFVENLIVVDFGSVKAITVIPTQILIENVAEFRRGDCTDDGWLNIADAALILGLQFSTDPAAQTSCEDACDVNDDGNINLADAVSLLFYLFKDGGAPAAPFFLTETVDGVSDFVKDDDGNYIPDEGPDPTDDPLDCETDVDCVPVL